MKNLYRGMIWLATTVMIVCKLFAIWDISWWIVFSPLWGSLLLALALYAVAWILQGLGEILEHFSGRY
jgi:hypothetical protein